MITHDGNVVYDGTASNNSISLQGDLRSGLDYYVTVTPVTNVIGRPTTTHIVFSNVGKNANWGKNIYMKNQKSYVIYIFDCSGSGRRQSKFKSR